MSRWIHGRGMLGIIAVATLILLWRAVPQTDERSPPAVSPFRIPAIPEDDRFPRVMAPWDFRFPVDHGSHDEYRTEWWSLTGVLEDEEGRRLGMQMVLTRLGLIAQPVERASRWAAATIYYGLFSISEPVAGALKVEQRLSRAALGLAGSATGPVRVWVENWRLELAGPGQRDADLRMHVAADNLELDLALRNQKPLIDANEIRGRDDNTTAPFQFYLQPRLKAAGTLRHGERKTAVSGTLSLEHAWGELPLPGGPVARDRFTLHLDDGRELFCIRSHRVDGTGSPTTTGLLVGPDAPPVALSDAEITLRPTAYWSSGQTGARYPVRWTLTAPDHGIDVELAPYRDQQEGVAWLAFWAGPVRIRGTSATTGPGGDGFVQLSGYDGS